MERKENSEEVDDDGKKRKEVDDDHFDAEGRARLQGGILKSVLLFSLFYFRRKGTPAYPSLGPRVGK